MSEEKKPAGKVVEFQFQAQDGIYGLSFETWNSKVLQPLGIDNQQAMSIALAKMAFNIDPTIGDLIEQGFIPASSVSDNGSDATAVRLMQAFVKTHTPSGEGAEHENAMALPQGGGDVAGPLSKV